MKVKARKELEEFKGPVESRLESAIKEREELDLSVPQNFTTTINFHESQNASGSAMPGSESHEISLNIAPMANQYLEEEDQKKARSLMNYFDYAREFFENMEEEGIIAFLENPKELVEDFEKSIGKENLERKKEFYKERGLTYEKYKEDLIEKSNDAKSLFEHLLPKLRKSLSDNGKNELSDVIRHELDHVDFFNSEIHKNKRRLDASKANAYRSFNVRNDKISSKRYALLNIAQKRFEASVKPLMEARATFFNYIGPNDWKGSDFGKVKGQVKEKILSHYVSMAYQPEILDALVSRKWAQGKMNRQTSNYLFSKIHLKNQSPDFFKYDVDFEKVDYNVASKVLYEEMPKFERMFAKNTMKSVDAMGDAYKEDPPRLKKANNAKTFNKFLRDAKGKKIFGLF